MLQTNKNNCFTYSGLHSQTDFLQPKHSKLGLIATSDGEVVCIHRRLQCFPAGKCKGVGGWGVCLSASVHRRGETLTPEPYTSMATLLLTSGSGAAGAPFCHGMNCSWVSPWQGQKLCLSFCYGTCHSNGGPPALPHRLPCSFHLRKEEKGRNSKKGWEKM